MITAPGIKADDQENRSSELDSTDGNVWTARLNKNDWTETATAPQQIAETIDHNEDEKHREVGVYRSHGGA
ncbi:hypothetical protein QYF36_005264 [Acer negundo]|nr:hypothetical protein QYF36_005264 [Acer negundo]